MVSGRLIAALGVVLIFLAAIAAWYWYMLRVKHQLRVFERENGNKRRK